MNAKKNRVTGRIFATVAWLLMIVSFVVYSINIGGEGYFQGAAVSQMPLTWAAVAALVVAEIVAALVNVKGAAAKVVDLVVGVLQIAAPAIVAYCLICLVGARVEGLGFIFFSNADVAKEVQTAANMSSATMAIASMVCYAVSMLAAIVSSFIDLKKD